MNTLLFRGLFFAGAAAVFAACKPADPLSPIPSIAFVSMEPRTVQAASSEDKVFLKFNFFDGDADLSVGSASTASDVFLIDSRDSSVREMLLPNIEDAMRDPVNGMMGDATLTLEAALLLPRNDSLHLATGDTLRYEVYIRDRAGNESNRFTTPDIFLTPP